MTDDRFAASSFNTILVTVLGRGPRKPRAPPKVPTAARAHRRPARSELVLVVFVLLLITMVAAVARSGWYTAASDLGYWLGVAGGVGMLVLLLYPLRKRWRAVRNVGTTKAWFALHMLLGIAGPLLIVLHSTLAFGSVNATVAFASMVLVMSSGIIGRFLYSRIHHGLFGRRATLAEVQAKLGLDAGLVHSKLAFAPRVERRLAEFARHADAVTRAAWLRHPVRFLTMGFEAARVRRQCTAEVARLLRKRARSEAWTREKLDRRTVGRRVLIAHYVRAVQQVAQFSMYEQLFSWWHVLHVPFLYMLVFSAIAHVIAVHMY